MALIDDLYDKLVSPNLKPDSFTLAGGGASGPTLYDLARNVGPYVMMCVAIYRKTGDTRFLEVPRTWYNEAKPHLIDRYSSGYREWLDGPNRTMDGLMTHAALWTWVDAIGSSDPDYSFWSTYLTVDYAATHGDPAPNHNLSHPTLARAIILHYQGEAVLAAGEVTDFLGATATTSVTGLAGNRTARVWEHNVITGLGAQRNYYARYTAGFAFELAHLGLLTEAQITEMAAAVSHYLIADPDGPMDLEPSIIGDDNPATGFSSSWTERRDADDWDVWPGFTLLAPRDELGTIGLANTYAHNQGFDSAAALGGLVYSDAAPVVVTPGGATTVSQAAGPATMTITIPTDAELGDLLVIAVGTESGTEQAGASEILGFTEIQDSFRTETNQVGLDVWIKDYTGLEGATLAWPVSTLANFVGVCFAIRGLSAVGDVQRLGASVQSDGGSSTATAPALTGSARLTNYALRFFVHRRISTAAVTWGAPSEGTEVAEVVANDIGMLVSSEVITGSTSFSLAAATATTSGDTSQDVLGLTLAIGGGLPLTDAVTPVYSDARMDALSVADGFNAPPTDVSIERHHLPAPLATITQDGFTALDEPFTPGVAELYYTPLGRQSTRYLQEFVGETVIARMARVYPAPIMALCSDITAPVIADNLTSDNTVHARFVIDYVFSLWAAQYGWFRAESAPDLRVPLLGGDYSGTNGVAYSSAILIPQIEDQEQTMLAIAQRLLAPFGAFRTINSNNDFEIRPRYGPDADATPVVTLKNNDVYTISTGAASRLGTKNRITVVSRPFEQSVDVTAMQEAYWQIRAYLYETQYMITDRTSDPPDAIPDSRLDLTDGIGTSGTVGYGAQYNPLFWPAAAGVVPEDVGFVDSGAVLQLDVDFKAYLLGTPGVTITKALSDPEVTLTYGNVLTDGNWYFALRAQYDNSAGSPMFVELEGRWRNDPGARGIEFRISDSDLVESGWWVGVTFYPGTFVGNFAIDITDSSRAWTDRGTETTVTYGNVSTDVLPAADGTNAIANSQAARGILEERIDVGPYAFSLDTLGSIAQGLLLDKIQPRSIRVIEQSVTRAHPIRFSHVGRLVELPDGEQGTVVSRSITEQAATVGGPGFIRSEAQVMVTDAAGAGSVDDCANYLLDTDGTVLLDTDGTPLMDTDGSCVGIDGNVLLESGDNVLLESGSVLLLEDA